MRITFALVLLAIGAGSLLFTLVTHACVRSVTRRRRASGPTPPLSVLKPMKGASEDLFDNLASLARQDYPSFELVLGCEDVTDPALGVARRLKQAFPNVPMTIVAGAPCVGQNPKVNNLIQLSQAARHDWLVVSDADVRVGPRYLRSLAAETADANVGLVSSVIAGVRETSLGATLDNLHMNGFIASTICGAEVLVGHPCVVGKSMLFRHSELTRLGGWDIVKDVLAEDYLLGRAFRDAGLRVALSGYVIHAVAGARAFPEFFRRHLRWGQMRRHIIPWHHAGEPLLLPTPWLTSALALAMGSASEAGNLELAVASAGLVGLIVRGLVDSFAGSLLRQVGTGEPPSSRRSRLRALLRAIHPADAVLVVFKDWVLIAVWFSTWFKTTVEWRGKVLRIGRESVLSPVTISSAAAPGATGRRAAVEPGNRSRGPSRGLPGAA